VFLTRLGRPGRGGRDAALIRIARHVDLAGQVGPFPAQVPHESRPPGDDGAQPVADAGQEAKMDEQPADPADQAADMHRACLQDRAAAGDVRGRAELVIPERAAGALAFEPVPDAVPGVQPGPHRDFGDAGQAAQAHHVTDDEDLGVARDGQVVADLDPAGLVALRASGPRQRGRDRRCRDPGGPQHGAGVVAGIRPGLVLDLQPALVHMGDRRAHVQLDAEVSQRLAGPAR
jgi:hypothetical protein